MSGADPAGKPFGQFKAMQREIWSGFAANEGLTTLAAAELVEFAKVGRGETVLDVACGTGVVAVTAALAGAIAKGLDITPALLERARENASIAGVDIEFSEGDAEELPYPDSSFDVVLSQFGHIFAPRPEVVTAEMLRVLKPGGRIAFTTWPAEHLPGQFFALIERNTPEPPAGAPVPASPIQWGDPNIVRTRLGAAVSEVRFERSTMIVPALSPRHVLVALEERLGPVQKLLASLDQKSPDRAAAVRAEIVRLASENTKSNGMRQSFLMSLATTRGLSHG